MPKIIFFGTPDFILPVLETLHKNFELIAIITQPDKPVGRKQILSPSPAKLFGLNNHIPVLTPAKLDDQFLHQLKSLCPHVDLALLAAYGKIIKPQLLNLPRHGFLNIHPSLLPLYRGATPTLGPILQGQTATGISYMLMDELMDHGPIVHQIPSIIDPEFNREQLTKALFIKSAQNLAPVISDYLSSANFTPQDHTKATYTPILTKQDGYLPLEALHNAIVGKQIDLSSFSPNLQSLLIDIYSPDQGPKFIHQACLALSPWPGLWTITTQNKRTKILTTSYQNGQLIIHKIQLEGKQPQAFDPNLL